jgi:hypothetical protein
LGIVKSRYFKEKRGGEEGRGVHNSGTKDGKFYIMGTTERRRTMQRYCIVCKEIFGCVGKGNCFISAENHCPELGSCVARINFDVKEVTGGICMPCLVAMNIQRVIQGKRPIPVVR